MSMIARIFSIGAYVISGVVLCAVGAFFLMPHIPGVPLYEVKIVKSGSMEPTIMTGGLVFIVAQKTYGVGDIVTFRSDGADIPTTHRIIGIETDARGESAFVTKGDANEERDTNLAYARDVIGRVQFSLPYAGYLLDFARKPVGFALLIGLPALLIIIDEVEKIWKSLRTMKKKRREDDEGGESLAVSGESDSERTEALRMVSGGDVVGAPRRVRMHDMMIPVREGREERGKGESREPRVREMSRFTPRALIVLIAFGTTSLLSPFGGTVAFYRNVETSSENMMRAGVVDFRITSDSNFFAFRDGELTDSDGALMLLPVPSHESSELRYDVSVEFKAGSPQFCDAIQVRTSGPFVYFGVLTGLMQSDVVLDTALVLELSMPSVVQVPENLCEVDVVYRGWDTHQESGVGYLDEERHPLVFETASGTPVIEPIDPLPPTPLPPVLYDEGGALMPDTLLPVGDGGDLDDASESSDEESTDSEQVPEEIDPILTPLPSNTDPVIEEGTDSVPSEEPTESDHDVDDHEEGSSEDADTTDTDTQEGGEEGGDVQGDANASESSESSTGDALS